MESAVVMAQCHYHVEYLFCKMLFLLNFVFFGRHSLPGEHIKAPFLLVAHGEETSQILLKTALKDCGYSFIATAKSGQQLFDRLEHGTFDLLVTAPEVSDITCWQILRFIASGRFCSPRLPVLIVCHADQVSSVKPLADEHRAALLAIENLHDIGRSVSAGLTGLNKPSLLVIEDDLDFAKLLEWKLDASFEIDLAPSGEDGLDLWRARQHQLILLDLMLPGIHGPEVLERILAEKPEQLVAVITARSERKTHQNLILAGAAALLIKPVNINEISLFCERLLHDHALLNQRTMLERSNQTARQMTERVEIANFFLETGRIGLAAEQIKHALAQRSNILQDDDWIRLFSQIGL